MGRPAMVMGLENEYSFYTEGWFGKPQDRRSYTSRIIDLMVQKAMRDPGIMGTLLPLVLDGTYANVSFLANGSRFYRDIWRPEISTPECTDPAMVVRYDGASEHIIRRAAQLAGTVIGSRVDIYKKNSDGHGNSYGCHENYSIDRELFYLLAETKDITPYQQVLATFLIFRQVLLGAGKIGWENGTRGCGLQMSQRADFIERFRSPMTTQARPIIQERNEPHANQHLWARLHLICGDANMCQWATYLKTGLTSLLLLMFQDSTWEVPPLYVLDTEWVQVMRMVSRDLDFECRYPVRGCLLAEAYSPRRKLSACDILRDYLECLAKYAQERAFRNPEEAAMYRDVTTKALWALERVAPGRRHELYGVLDWPTKWAIVRDYLVRKGRTREEIITDEAFRRKVRVLADLAYSSLDPERSLFADLDRAGKVKRIVAARDVRSAISHPPPGRAYQRGQILSRFGSCLKDVVHEGIDEVVDWSQLVFRNDGSIISVVLENPFGGTQERLDRALGVSTTLKEFVRYVLANPIPGIMIYEHEDKPSAGAAPSGAAARQGPQGPA